MYDRAVIPTPAHPVHDLLGFLGEPDNYTISQPAIRASAKAQHQAMRTPTSLQARSNQEAVRRPSDRGIEPSSTLRRQPIALSEGGIISDTSSTWLAGSAPCLGNWV